jgi:hypothetical protein
MALHLIRPTKFQQAPIHITSCSEIAERKQQAVALTSAVHYGTFSHSSIQIPRRYSPDAPGSSPSQRPVHTQTLCIAVSGASNSILLAILREAPCNLCQHVEATSSTIRSRCARRAAAPRRPSPQRAACSTRATLPMIKSTCICLSSILVLP